MPTLQTHIPDNLNHPEIISWFHGLPALSPELDHKAMNEVLAKVEKVATFLGEITVESDQDRELLGQLAVATSGAAERFEVELERVNSLPKHVHWREKAYDAVEHLVCRIEDIAETSALVADKQFTELIETQVEAFLDERKNDGGVLNIA